MAKAITTGRGLVATVRSATEKRRTMWALTAEEMKECRWLKPKLVAQFAFTERTPDGHLRHSSFVGLQNDKEPMQIVRK